MKVLAGIVIQQAVPQQSPASEGVMLHLAL